MAEEFDTMGYYSPQPGHDMWSFGLLLLEMLGIGFKQLHVDAMLGDATQTRAFARTLLGSPCYYGVVST